MEKNKEMFASVYTTTKVKIVIMLMCVRLKWDIIIEWIEGETWLDGIGTFEIEGITKQKQKP